MTDLEAEARRRVQRSTPSLTDEQFAAWLAAVATRGGTLALTLDGCLASYPNESASPSEVRATKGLR